jgi:hypothetical protein
MDGIRHSPAGKETSDAAPGPVEFRRPGNRNGCGRSDTASEFTLRIALRSGRSIDHPGRQACRPSSLEVSNMRKALPALALSLLFAQAAMAGGGTQAAVGGGLGGALGNVVGQQLGGSTGAAIGAGVGGAAGSAATAKKGRKTKAAIGGGLGAAGGSLIGNKLGGSTGAAIGAGLGGAAGGALGGKK